MTLTEAYRWNVANVYYAAAPPPPGFSSAQFIVGDIDDCSEELEFRLPFAVLTSPQIAGQGRNAVGDLIAFVVVSSKSRWWKAAARRLVRCESTIGVTADNAAKHTILPAHRLEGMHLLVDPRGSSRRRRTDHNKAGRMR
jgi:hypothetical protein